MSLVDCILDLETDVVVGSALSAPRFAIVLFDCSAAFPSVEVAASDFPASLWLEGVIHMARGIKERRGTSGLLSVIF